MEDSGRKQDGLAKEDSPPGIQDEVKTKIMNGAIKEMEEVANVESEKVHQLNGDSSDTEKTSGVSTDDGNGDEVEESPKEVESGGKNAGTSEPSSDACSVQNGEDGASKQSSDSEDTKDAEEVKSDTISVASDAEVKDLSVRHGGRDSTKERDNALGSGDGVSGASGANGAADDSGKGDTSLSSKDVDKTETCKLGDKDDEVKITKEVIKSDESDIEMIEQSDPLAISDADMKKAQRNKEVKKEPNVIIIDTNTLLRSQGNLVGKQVGISTAPIGKSVTSVTPAVTAVSSSPSIQPFAAASLPTQGIQNAYLAAIQQVLLNQGGSGSQYLTQLQQYYNTLGVLQDDAYVIEAPSFIVPYVIEGKPKETISDYLKKIAEEQAKQEKLAKEKEEEAAKSEEKSEEEREESKKEGSDKENEKEAVTEQKEEKTDKSTDSDSVVEVEKPASTQEDFSHLGRWESYYKSALGSFFLDLGLNRVKEFIESDLIRMQKRRLEKMKTAPTKLDIATIRGLEKHLEETRKKNAHLSLPLRTCRFCNFRTESDVVMQRHLEAPHMINYTYKCNYCDFETRGPQVILFHMEAEHNVRGRLERAPAFFQCPLCPFEDNNKSKITRHSLSCAKKFKMEKNCDLPDWEAPAKIPKIQRGRPAPLSKGFEPLKVQGLLPKTLTNVSIGGLQSVSSGLLNTAANSISVTSRGRGRPVGTYKSVPAPAGFKAALGGAASQVCYRGPLVQTSGATIAGSGISIGGSILQGDKITRLFPGARGGVAPSSVSLVPGLSSSSVTIQSVAPKPGISKNPQQPSISITPLPRAGHTSSPVGPKVVPSSPGGSRDSSGKPSFVICEICDSYIKDLDQLRSHMSVIHKVKIHPKMIYNRPPLNCQKCQQRFFTDQGLERHLLGTHGLVTSSMQEAANKARDAGRCPICGKVFEMKLLNHVHRDHKMTLKPAHLSYKCTVCTATFNMYRLFENHVYSAHSVVPKKGNDGVPPAAGKDSIGKKVNGTDTSLKINDEITIIPQPSGKVPGKLDARTMAKKSDKVSVSKEITITKVGTKGGSSSGNPVEVISLEESPKKKQTTVPTTPVKRLRPQRETATSKRARLST